MIVPVAGIGASSEGLEACKLLLAHLPANPGLAFVLVHHAGNLAPILDGPAVIPVRHAAQGMAVEPGCLYVAPPGAALEIANHVLTLSPAPAPSPHMPFDRLLLSLAQEYGSRAIGVLLSGAGSGWHGRIRSVEGGRRSHVHAGSATAVSASMPRTAIARECVDFVGAPEAIAARLAELGRHPYVVEDPCVLYNGAGAQFEIILALLRGATGIDFDLDRDAWVQRRILRRLALCNFESLAEYRARLENDPAELGALHRDLLLCTTGSFRDLQSFDPLKQLVFPRILQGRPPRAPVRVWVPGCATGEEAFSIAVTLSEYLDHAGVSLPIRIFASDTSPNFIERARWGRYPDKIATDVSPARLNRHFIRIDGGYQVDKDLLEMCVFTRHNLFADPPFSKLDLVSCRNLPGPAASEQNLIPMFHYALKPNGFLIFGGSATAALRELFSPVDPAHGIYVRREPARKPRALRPAAVREPPPDNLAEAPRYAGNDTAFRQEVDRILLSRYSPAGVVVDQDLEVLEIRGDPGSFLSLPAGKLSFNLFKLIPEASLFLEVERLVHEARSTGRPARREGIPLDGGARTGEVAVEVVPLRKNALLILFEAVPAGGAEETAASSPVEPAGLNDRRIERLKLELADARKRLEAAVEEHRISREESLQSAEEALSTTEELHSLNQELETAKEELQSTNETLTAVNQELQSNIAALTAAPGFALSVIDTVAAPLLILDTDLRIKAANPSF